MGFVPYKQRHGYIVSNLPAPHLRRLAKQVAKQNTSATNIVGRIIADRYGLPFEPSARKHPRPISDSSLSVRLPAELWAAVEGEAVERRVTMRSVILDALSDGLRLKAPEPTPVYGRRPGRPRKD